MKKKLLIIFLTAILGLIFFNTDFCLAVLEAPTNPQVPSIGEGSVILSWQWTEPINPTEGKIHRFEISYREEGKTSWTTPTSQPDGTQRNWLLGGLIENTEYEWTIMAKAIEGEDNSSKTPGPNFETTQAELPDPPPDNNGGGMGPITLKNPLNQESLWDAIDAVLNFLILIAFAIVPILIIYSAFLMIFAGGDSIKINRAKTIISWTLIALAVILSAKILPSVIKGAFGG